MARQSPQRPDADKPAAETDDLAGPGEEAVDEAPAASGDRGLWEDVRIDPVEIALPAGAGFTLRAYRPANEVTPTDIAEREDDDLFAAKSRHAVAAEEDDDDETVVILDEEFLAAAEDDETDRGERPGKHARDDEDETDADARADEDEVDTEEVPVFLTHRGRLLLFKTPESLVGFVRSGAPNDLAQLDTWADLTERIQPADVTPLDEDSYELDLVVENLRGGHDTWDAPLLIEAGEVARDLAYALRLPSVLDMLSAGSSLDDLDEALRSTVDGGIGGFMGRRRLKKIGAQTASLGWRTIIGKISAAVDWRD
ncbi:DNA primase [Micromonospora sp. NPDC049679]|uniref:DNA primase n=1 Tax=Micromonospora sp. NPDC049679 TaxID=3155920 RepID=UPI0033C862B8